VLKSNEQPGTTETVDGARNAELLDSILRVKVGDGGPKIMMICGYFKTLYGSSMDLFETLSAPIVENFSAGDHLDTKLKLAMAELMSQEIGSGAMTGALLKQVIVALVRKSLSSIHGQIHQCHWTLADDGPSGFADASGGNRPGGREYVDRPCGSQHGVCQPQQLRPGFQGGLRGRSVRLSRIDSGEPGCLKVRKKSRCRYSGLPKASPG
jgi:hypothetical protein